MKNRDRLNYLEEKIQRLNEEIQDKGLEAQYLELASRIAKREITFEPISEDQWNVMLPKERDEQLLAYYHTFRAELHQRLKERPKEHLVEWLEKPWVKVTITVPALVDLAMRIVELGQGVLYFKNGNADSDSIV